MTEEIIGLHRTLNTVQILLTTFLHVFHLHYVYVAFPMATPRLWNGLLLSLEADLRLIYFHWHLNYL